MVILLRLPHSSRQTFELCYGCNIIVLALCSDDDEEPPLLPAAAAAPPGSYAAAAAAGPGGAQRQEASPGAAVDFLSDPESSMVQLPSPSRQRAAAWEDAVAAAEAGCPDAEEAGNPQRQSAHGSDAQAAAALGAAAATLVHQQFAEQQPGAPDAHAGGCEPTSQVTVLTPVTCTNLCTGNEPML